MPKRQKLARIYGADAIVDHTGEDATDRSMELTNGEGVYSAIEALGSEQTLQNAIKVTKPSGTISNVGYHGKGDYVGLPRLDWGVGDGEKPIRTGLCTGGRLRMERLIRLLQTGSSRPRISVPCL